MQRVLIRADGKKSLGMGHLNRAHLLANELAKISNLRSCLLTRDSDEARIFLGEKPSNYDVIWLKEEANARDEEVVVRGLVEKYYVKYFITDILEHELTRSYLKFLRGLGKPLIAIVDMSEFYDLDVDLVINGNPNQLNFEYGGPSKHLSGPEYFIMEPGYFQLPDRIWVQESRKVLVCLGGSDHNNLIFKILHALDSIKDIAIKIVTSHATGYIDELKKFCLKHPANIQIKIDIDSLRNEWSEVDFAITAGGNVLFERIASATPGVTICQLPRQMEIANYFQEQGVNINLGYGLSLDSGILKIKFNELFESGVWKKRQIELCKSVVPGDGLRHCIDNIMQLGV